MRSKYKLIGDLSGVKTDIAEFLYPVLRVFGPFPAVGGTACPRRPVRSSAALDIAHPFHVLRRRSIGKSRRIDG
jgi:hypothetical protein